MWLMCTHPFLTLLYSTLLPHSPSSPSFPPSSQEPPAEEANLVEKILSHREREPKDEAERKAHGEVVEEFLVKYKN